MQNAAQWRRVALLITLLSACNSSATRQVRESDVDISYTRHSKSRALLQNCPSHEWNCLPGSSGAEIWWSFDDFPGPEVTDQSGHGLHGTIYTSRIDAHNGVLLGSDAAAEGQSAAPVPYSSTSLALDGTNFVMQGPMPSCFVADHPDTFTVEFWVKPGLETALIREDAADHSVLHSDQADQPFVTHPLHAGYYLDSSSVGYRKAGVGVAVGSNGVSVHEHTHGYFHRSLHWVAPQTESLSGVWTLVTVVYEQRVPSLYVNKVLKRTGIASTKEVYASVYLGYFASANWVCCSSFKGQVDEFRVFGHAIERNQVATTDLDSLDCNSEAPTQTETPLSTTFSSPRWTALTPISSGMAPPGLREHGMVTVDGHLHLFGGRRSSGGEFKISGGTLRPRD